MDSRGTEHPESAPPSLTELFSHYVKNADIQAADYGTGLVEPYDSGVSHPVDAGLAWQGAVASLASIMEPGTRFERPAEWITLVQSRDSYPAVALAAGNFPQMLRDLPALLQVENLADLRGTVGPVHELPGLSTWAARTAGGSFVGRLLAAGVLRLAGQFEHEYLRDDSGLSKLQRLALQNERAALLWSRGDCDSAVELWQELSDTAIGQFNLGMSALFDKPAQALPFLQTATKLLADEDPWRHLAGIYLALAEMRA